MQPDELSRASREAVRQRFLTVYLAAAIIAAGILLLLVMRYLEPAVTETRQIHDEKKVSLVSQGDVAELRDEFKAVLKYFESDVENQLVMANIQEWDPKTQGRIGLLKDKALFLFDQGDYAKAIGVLRDAESLTDQALIVWKEKYQTAYLQALSFFNTGSADMARMSIDEALLLQPSNQDALLLKRRIEVLPEVNRLLAEVAVAEVENDRRNEHLLLRNILAVDPARVELKERISRLGRRIAEEDFGSLIDAGFKAVDALNLSQAKKALREAKAVFPSRPEIRILNERILKASRGLSLSAAIIKGDALAKRDDWPMALAVYEKALQSHPDNRELIDKTRDARKIILLGNTISGYLSKHHRLSSLNVSLMAKKVLADADNFLGMSRSLASKSGALAKMLAQYDSPADLIVHSDGSTHVTVRGVGNVGVVKQKQVKLRPGRYVLEGKRSGFRSKLVDVTIHPGQDIVTVKVVCDERI